MITEIMVRAVMSADTCALWPLNGDAFSCDFSGASDVGNDNGGGDW